MDSPLTLPPPSRDPALGTDIRPLVRSLYIVDTSLNVVRLGDVESPMQTMILDETQRLIDEGQPVRIRVLKARQMGCSTVIEAIMFTMAMLLQNMKGLVVSHESDSAEHLLGMTKHYWDTFWAKDLFTTTSQARNQLSWAETNSLLKISTAKNQGSGRSRTLHFIHGSEVAFWNPSPETLLTGLNQVLPRKPLTFFYQESTANGVGNWWHKACKTSLAGDDEFTLLFFGWWEHPTYRASQIGRGDLLDLPWVFMDDEEKKLWTFLERQPMDSDEIKDRLLWRRTIIATECLGDIDKFHQEYPTTFEEAFVSTGHNIFPLEYLRNAYKPVVPDTGHLIPRPNGGVEFIPDPDNTTRPGPLKVFRYPGDRRLCNYVIGGDPAWSAAGDWACAQVLNMDSWEQCAVFRQKIDANTLGEQMVLLGRWYNEALLVPEATKAGGATTATIRARGYDNLFIHIKSGNIRGQMDTTYGWVTNEQTKHEVVSNLQKAFYEASLPINKTAGLGILLHDEHTYTELKEYIKVEGRGTFGNSAGTNHDDTVMAIGIALTSIFHEAGKALGGGQGEPKYNRLASPVSPEIAAFEETMGDLGVKEHAVMEEAHQMREAGPSPWLEQGVDAFGSNYSDTEEW